jgi:hypothetical protein
MNYFKGVLFIIFFCGFLAVFSGTVDFTFAQSEQDIFDQMMDGFDRQTVNEIRSDNRQETQEVIQENRVLNSLGISGSSSSTTSTTSTTSTDTTSTTETTSVLTFTGTFIFEDSEGFQQDSEKQTYIFVQSGSVLSGTAVLIENQALEDSNGNFVEFDTATTNFVVTGTIVGNVATFTLTDSGECQHIGNGTATLSSDGQSFFGTIQETSNICGLALISDQGTVPRVS